MLWKHLTFKRFSWKKRSGKHFFWRHDWNNSFKDFFCTIFSSIVSEFLVPEFPVKAGSNTEQGGHKLIDQCWGEGNNNWPWHLYYSVFFSLLNLILPLRHYLLPPSHVVFSCPFLYDNYMSFPSLALAVMINRGHCEQVCKTDWNACVYQCVGGKEVLTHNLTSLPFS